jgi:hypothetical protein
MQIGMADTRAADLHQDLAGARLRLWNVRDRCRLPDAVESNSLHGDLPSREYEHLPEQGGAEVQTGEPVGGSPTLRARGASHSCGRPAEPDIDQRQQEREGDRQPSGPRTGQRREPEETVKRVGPGPVKASTKAPVAYINGSSIPLFSAKKP